MKRDRGYTGEDQPAGFADNAHYDRSPSPYSSTGSSENNTTGVDEGWTKVFTDIFLEAIGITDFNQIEEIEQKVRSSVIDYSSQNSAILRTEKPLLLI